MVLRAELSITHANNLIFRLPPPACRQVPLRRLCITAYQSNDAPQYSNERRSSEGGRGRGRGGGRGYTRDATGRGRGGGGRGRGRGDFSNNTRANTPSESEVPVVRIGPGKTAQFFSSQSWSKCGADDDMVAALEAFGVTRPSHIQASALQALSTGAPHVVLADHAGSGKTLAYIVPLVQALKAEEKALGKPATIPNSPRVVVVVPTSELCAQVLRVCRALSSTLRFRAVAATGGRPMRTQKEALDQGVDVLVGTPGRLAELLSSGALKLDNCASLVCDEVDVLLGGASMFAEQVAPLKQACPPSTRWILVTATLPNDVYMQLEPLFPGLVSALGPGLHRTAPGVTEQIVDCSGGDEITEESGMRRKAAALFASLQERRALRTIVFCNKIETCRKVENFLNRTFSKEDNVKMLPYHTAVAAEQREGNLKTFLLPPGQRKSGSGGGGKNAGRQYYKDNGELESAFSSETSSTSNGTNNPERLILVCTDRASRGVDSAFVDHVVLFDFPRDPSEYVRRVGRTARGAGGQGVVTVLVLGRQVKLAQDVIGRNAKGLPVHALPAVMAASGMPMAGGGGAVGSFLDEDVPQFSEVSERRVDNNTKNDSDDDFFNSLGQNF
jgi:ATP-dependent RNA helicase DDX18/HAS1